MRPQKALKIIQKTKEDYNRIADHFNLTRKYNWPEIVGIINSLKIPQNAKVLDLGCGNGRLYGALKNYQINYTGIDISSRLIKIAQKKYPKAKFTVGDLTKFYTKEKFDYIFCIAALHHVPSRKLREQVLKNIKSTLSEKGVAVISVWYFWNKPFYIKKILTHFFSFQNLFKREKFLPLGDFYVPWKDNKGKIIAQRYHHAFTKREFVKNGFKIISCNKNLIALYSKNN